MYAARNSGLKKEMFGYVRGGYARVLERFGEHLREKGVEIRLNSRVEKIEKTGDGKIEIFGAKTPRREGVKSAFSASGLRTTDYKLQNKFQAETADFNNDNEFEISNPKSEIDEDRFDQVILTCPATVAARICPQLTETEKTRLENVKYQGIVCASLLMKKSLSPFYVTNITAEAPFAGFIEKSALGDEKEFDGYGLVYLPV